jgi:hypothetical protein
LAAYSLKPGFEGSLIEKEKKNLKVSKSIKRYLYFSMVSPYC